MDWPWSKHYHRRCPDGSTKLVHKNVDEALPLHVGDHRNDVRTERNMLQEVPAQVREAQGNRIEGVLVVLDEQSHQLVYAFRVAYLDYSNDPCSNNDRFQRQLDRLLEERHRLSVARVQLQALLELAKNQPHRTDAILQMFKDVTQQLRGEPISEVASMEVKESQNDARNWIGASNGG
jgi:hypothetical protein